MFAAIKESADQLMASTEPGKERDLGEQKMAQIQARWDRVQKDTADRQALLEQLEPVAQKYQETVQETMPWLSITEKKLESLNTVPCSPKPLEAYGKSLKEIREDVAAREDIRNGPDEIGRAVLQFYPEDQDVVKSVVLNVKSRWENIDDSLNEKEANLEKVKELLASYHGCLRGVEELVVKAVVLCARITPLMDPDGVHSEVDLIDEMLAALADKEDELGVAQDLAYELCQRLGENSPEAPLIAQQVKVLGKRFRVVRARLQKRKPPLEKHEEHLRPFVKNNADLTDWFGAMNEQIDNWEPISTEPEKLKEQLKEVEEMQDKVQDQGGVLQAVLQDGDWLIQNNKEDEIVTVSVVTQLSEAQVKMDRIAAKVDERKDKLLEAILESQDVQVTFAEFLNDLNNIEEQLASMRPVSAVHDTLKEQEREHKVGATIFQCGHCVVSQSLARPFYGTSQLVNENLARALSMK